MDPAAAEAHGPSEDEAEAPLVTDAEVRKVRVRTRRLATIEDVVRYQIRHVEARRPRELYPTRMLLRLSAPARVRNASAKQALALDRDARRWIRDERASMKACILGELVEDPRILLKAPAGLVLEHVRALEPELAVRLRLVVDVGRAGVEVRTVDGRDRRLSARTRECIRTALRGVDSSVDGLARSHRVELRLLAFIQPAWGMNLGNVNHMLAIQAATLGWVHYERGEFAEAEQYFRDAYWEFHLAEFQYLLGLALEKRGDVHGAAKAYAQYAEARPYAPEVPALAERIARSQPDDAPK